MVDEPAVVSAVAVTGEPVLPLSDITAELLLVHTPLAVASEIVAGVAWDTLDGPEIGDTGVDAFTVTVYVAIQLPGVIL